jgi:putative transposase
LCGFTDLRDFQRAHRQWVEKALEDELAVRDARWSEAIAVGSLAFVEKVKSELGVKAMHRELVQVDGTYALRERSEAYAGEYAGENDVLALENTVRSEENTESAET